MDETTTVVMVEIRTKILEMLLLNLLMVVMAVTRMTGILMREVTMKMVGIRTTMVVIGGIKAIGVETKITATTGTTKISTMATMMGSGIKALGLNTEGIQMVDSTMQMEGTTMKSGEYDDTSPILFAERNKHHVKVTPQLISVLPVFRGHKNDDPYNHLYDFLAISNTNTPRGTNRDPFRLHSFMFILK
uniref:Uncharacterized protein n=1 Tax=Lactuca sativa TaxID=4236 RepID=A0A9R1X398_LACSA|nr:hypothetical protein LSAT_V11C700373610 [Lactuca sativa]